MLRSQTPSFARPAFRRMLDDIEAGCANCVIVKDLSRFGRDYIDTGKYLERYFPERRVRFISITDAIDSFQQAYDMLLPIKNIFNEQYARDISRKIHASMQTKQRAGEFIGAFASYGYKKSPADKNKLIVDEYAASIVRRIFRLYIAGHGKIRIASILNEDGVVCPSEYKRLGGENYKNGNRLPGTSYWTYSSINRILQNEMYIGHMVQGKKSQRMRQKPQAREKKDWIIRKDTHEAIIDEETWNKTQALLKRRTRSLDLHTNQSMFAGFLKCGDCGRALVKKAGASGSLRYSCGTYVRSGRQYCTPHAISHDFLEKILLEDLRALLQNIDDLRAAAQAQTAKAGRPIAKAEKSRWMAELEKVQRLKKAVYEDYRSGLISREECTAYRQDYLQKETLLQKQLAEAGKQNEAAPDMWDDPWTKRLLNFRTIEKLDRQIIVEMLQEIQVFENNKIKIIYNFSHTPHIAFQNVYANKEKTG